MAEPWQCPECKTWLAPHVSEHRCDPEDGVGAALAPVTPFSPATTTTASNVTMTFSGTTLAPGILRQVQSHARRNPGSTYQMRSA